MLRTAGLLGPIERVLRVVGGGLLALVSVYVALGSSGLAIWAWVAAALLGLDFVVTGLRGYCPLYARLGIGRGHEHSGA
jgi:hypothetical protein